MLLFVTIAFIVLANLQNVHSSESPRAETVPKYILMWTPDDIHPFNSWGTGQKIFLDYKCPFSDCYITTDRNYLSSDITKFDAVVFNGRNIRTSKTLPPYTDFPQNRSNHQKYIFLNMESADYQPVCDVKFDGFFNWTATYKLNSDIQLTYLLITDKTGETLGPRSDMTWMNEITEIDEDLKNILNKKTKAVAWFASRCKSRSKREVYVDRMQEELKKHGLVLDRYGQCGPLQCPREKQGECDELLKDNYYFYLSFENSFADDYVTEKVLNALLNYNVPIVYGGANYSSFLPPGSYLDATQHKAKKLASTIARLIRKPSEYYDFFRWRNHYNYFFPPDRVCGLCAALHNDTMVRTHSVYQGFRRWWNPDYVKRCKKIKMFEGDIISP